MSAAMKLTSEQNTPIYKPAGTGSDGSQFTTVSLEKKKKAPKRILHFSDGVLEEYSTDEDEETTPMQPPVDPKMLTWMPWMWHYMSTCAFKEEREKAEEEKAMEARGLSTADVKLVTSDKQIVGETLDKY
ncbi:hypothetical protein BaRGS_00034061 [Batillaria attramentaria]|uniref:Uncharacterized protein n=1 Tax=Batillaria attramentaria TaxID=370345 RepID=A0ABD0JIN3_9CAEN